MASLGRERRLALVPADADERGDLVGEVGRVRGIGQRHSTSERAVRSA